MDVEVLGELLMAVFAGGADLSALPSVTTVVQDGDPGVAWDQP